MQGSKSTSLVSTSHRPKEARPPQTRAIGPQPLKNFRLERRRALVGEIAGLIATGNLHAPIQATYDVSEIKDAVATAASGGRSGKILIVPRR